MIKLSLHINERTQKQERLQKTSCLLLHVFKTVTGKEKFLPLTSRIEQVKFDKSEIWQDKGDQYKWLTFCLSVRC